jgi:hypothetical protein
MLCCRFSRVIPNGRGEPATKVSASETASPSPSFYMVTSVTMGRASLQTARRSIQSIRLHITTHVCQTDLHAS